MSLKDLFNEALNRTPRAMARRAMVKLIAAQQELFVARINTAQRKALLDIATLDEHLAREDLVITLRELYPHTSLPTHLVPRPIQHLELELDLEFETIAN